MNTEKMNVEDVLSKLSKDRPIFHSEGDFQFSLAHKIKKIIPEFNVRLEFPMSPGHLDIFLFSSEKAVLFELKYKPTELVYNMHNKEKFNLKQLRRIDYGFYGFIKDIYRLENFRLKIEQNFKNVECYALILTNDKRFWQQTETKGMYKEFLIYEGKKLSGVFNWANNITNEYYHKRPSIILNHTYRCFWKDYSKITIEAKNNQFRFLLIEVI